MNQQKKDALEQVRDARNHLSSQFDHDPEQLIKHLIEVQATYRERLVEEPQPKRQKAA